MQEMSDEDIRRAIEEASLAILGLARGNRAYAFPLFYGYRDGTFYWHSHPGEKDDFAHATEEACLTIVRAVTEDDWYSVMAFGRPREVHDTKELELVQAALADVPAPPEIGDSEMGEPLRSAEDVVYWKLEPTHVTGRVSQPPPPDDTDVT